LDGTFILRIEDTDRSRSTEEFIAAIIEGMKWLGLDWDEGPFRQTDRFDIYRRYAERLIREGKAYYCYCTAEELEARRKEAMEQGKSPKYDGRCRHLKEPPGGRSGAVRFMMPQSGHTVVDDLIRGKVVFENSQLDDLIILRSDGTPTYNLTVVVDDVDMKITHIVRGDDHLNNTPKQIQLYQAFGYEVPEFAHLPMILGPDKTRLSKRHGATSVLAYREMGYLPEALLNYLVRLGWSHGDQEIFTRDELIRHFSFDSIGKAAAVFNPEKLLWLNSQYMMNTSPGVLAEMAMPFLIGEEIVSEGEQIDREWLARAINTLKERSKTLVDLAKSLRYYISIDVKYDQKAKDKFLNEKTLPYLGDLRHRLDTLNEFSHAALEQLFRSVTETHGIKLGALAQPVRVAVTGGTESPGIFDVLEVLGKEKTLKKLDNAMRMIETSQGGTG